MVTTPFDHIKARLRTIIPSDLHAYLPKKWEKIGDILILKLDPHLRQHASLIGKTYATILESRSVLCEHEGISGTFREPTVEVIYGDTKTETIHVENAIRFRSRFLCGPVRLPERSFRR